MRRGFVINSTVLVLLIPLLLLLATYSDVTSYVIQAQSQATRLKTTQDVVSYLQTDLQNVLQLSVKRALVLSISYVTSVEPLDNAQLALESLVLYGRYGQIESSGPEWAAREREFMGNTTLLDWLRNMEDYLAEMGYTMLTPPEEVLSSVKLTIAPLDSFHIVANVTIPSIAIADMSGKIIYNSSIPPEGSLYVVMPITYLEDPLVSYLTGGRYSRIILPCNFAYPNITPPYYLLEGYGESSLSRFAAPFAPVVDGNRIYYGDSYPGDGALAYVLKNQPTAVSAPYVFGVSINGTVVSPGIVLRDGDMGAMVFFQTATTDWCDDTYSKRVSFTVNGGLELLVMSLPVEHNGPYADMRIYDSSCSPARYWIEYWDGEALIWFNSTGGEFYIYYDSDGAPLSRGYLSNVFGDNYLEDVTLAPGERLEVFSSNVPAFVRYNLTALYNGPFNAGLHVEVPGKGLEVEVDYPERMSTQVPVYLNSTWTALFESSDDGVKIRVFNESGEVPFWVEYWGDEALIWVKTTVPGRLYIEPGDEFTWGDGREVFPFFDDFSYLSDGMDSATIATLLEENGWNVGGNPYYLTSGTGVLNVWGDSYTRDADVWLWTQRTFPASYVIGMSVYVANRPFWFWYVDDYGWAWMEHIIFRRGYLGDFNVWTGDYSDYETGGRYTKNAWTRVEIAVDYGEFTTYQNQSGPFQGTWDGNTVEVSYYSRSPEWDESVGLGQFYSGPSRYRFFYVRDYLDLNELETTVKASGSSLQFVDNWTTAGRLFILENWNRTLASYPTGTWPIDVPNRYEVDLGEALNFTHYPSGASSRAPYDLGQFTVSLVANNTDNYATFGWVFWGRNYTLERPVLSAVEVNGGDYSYARVYDLQPFIDCLLEGRYFGVSGAPSFFERLEASDANRARYTAMAMEMQKAVYGRVKYPIGLVSFILPSELPDNLDFLVRKQPAVDYIYLDFTNYPGNDDDCRDVLGISASGFGFVLDENFYLTQETAAFIFAYPEDLLVPIGTG